jgi:hypothetical protein
VKTKRNFLIFAFAAVAVIASLYGLSPSWFARTFLDVDQLGVDQAHIFRAVMCLYLGLGLFWLWAAFRDRHRDTAVLTVMIFSGGLVVGRAISIIADGPPSPLLMFYAAIEIAIVPAAYWVYTRPD